MFHLQDKVAYNAKTGEAYTGIIKGIIRTQPPLYDVAKEPVASKSNVPEFRVPEGSLTLVEAFNGKIDPLPRSDKKLPEPAGESKFELVEQCESREAV